MNGLNSSISGKKNTLPTITDATYAVSAVDGYLVTKWNWITSHHGQIHHTLFLAKKISNRVILSATGGKVVHISNQLYPKMFMNS